MVAELNHTIVWARDKRRSAEFLAGILGVPVRPPWGPFLPVVLGNNATLDYADLEIADFADETMEPQPQHLAFLVSEEEFDAALGRLAEQGVPIYADPHGAEPGEINDEDGGRGVHFHDPDGHPIELITRPYSLERGRVLAELLAGDATDD